VHGWNEIRAEQGADRLAQQALSGAGHRDATDEAGWAPEPAEAWEHTQRGSVQGWKEILAEHGVDRLAQQALYLLAQHSDEGYRSANSIVHKVIKKASSTDGQGGLRNASGFVSRAVENARNNMQ
jgi:hypothetical protein